MADACIFTPISQRRVRFGFGRTSTQLIIGLHERQSDKLIEPERCVTIDPDILAVRAALAELAICFLRPYRRRCTSPVWIRVDGLFICTPPISADGPLKPDRACDCRIGAPDLTGR